MAAPRFIKKGFKLVPESDLIVYNKRTESTFTIETARYRRRTGLWLIILNAGEPYEFIVGDFVMFLDTEFKINSVVSSNGELIVDMERVQ